jgi:hypothetical protein
MMYRVVFDFGDIEVTVFHRSVEKDQQEIVDGAIQQVIDRGFGFPAEPSMTTVEPCPEWEADETIAEWCSNCCAEVELPARFEEHICPNCHEKILPCAQCVSQECGKCPLTVKA